MPLKIGADRDRFRQIVHNRIRGDLKKYIANGSIIAQKGKDRVNIPIHSINMPRFTFNDKDQGGTGQGKGQPGDPIDGGEGEGEGSGKKAGDGTAEHEFETDVSLEELANILGEELELPRIENKGKKAIESDSNRYNSIRKFGPDGLRHFKRTYKEALKREIASGSYVPGQAFVPRKEDKRFRASNVVQDAVANAVIIYMMDVSGSMGDEQKEIVRLTSFWINTWIKRHYKGLENVYIVHDTEAKVVDENTFFRTKEAGGTTISSAYELCAQVIDSKYSPNDWNIYVFHFSDGDNYGDEDNHKSIAILRDKIIPASNMFAYGQTDSSYGSGQFMPIVVQAFEKEEKVAVASIRSKDDILVAIKAFLSKGH